ncbi:MAG: TolC family outer membrane protein [Alcaligenaceae bacterium]|nr:TolC family outer membrane protein [Alcaligenaceae bacterium]
MSEPILRRLSFTLYLALPVALTGCAGLETPVWLQSLYSTDSSQTYDTQKQTLDELLVQLQSDENTAQQAVSVKSSAIPGNNSPVGKNSALSRTTSEPAWNQSSLQDLKLANGTTRASLRESVERALLGSQQIMSSFQNFQAALQGQEIDRGRLMPQVNFQGQAGYDWRYRSPQPPSSESWNRSGMNLGLSQLLYDGNATRNTVKQLGLEKLATYYDLLTTTDAVANEAVNAYIDVVRYRHMIELAQENYNIHKKTLGLLSERLDSGVGRGVDTEHAAGRLALAQTNLMTENNNLNNVNQRYRRLMGDLPPKHIAPVPEPRLPTASEMTNFGMAIRNNPDILSKQAMVQAAQASTDAARGNFSPTLELRASTSSERDNPTSSNYGALNNRVEVVMNYALFRGGSDTARLRQSSAQTLSARNVRDHTCRNLQQELSTTWNDIQRTRAQLPFLKDHEKSMEKVSVAAEQQFQIGQRSLLDLLDTANELFDSRRARLNGEYDLLKLEYRWLALAHRLLPELGLAEPLGTRPAESSELLLPDEVIQACAAPIPDTKNLAPGGLVYQNDGLPPIIRAASKSGR